MFARSDRVTHCSVKISIKNMAGKTYYFISQLSFDKYKL